MAIRIGPAGTGMSSLEGIENIAQAGLDACEIEFTYGVRMSNELADKVGAVAKKHGIALSVHAPYYINLASDDPEKIKASEVRIVESAERAHHLGAKFVVFHAGFYGKRSKEETYDLIRQSIIRMRKAIDDNGWKVILAPETTGKASQFGNLDELLRLARDAGCSLCVDFAHLLAREKAVDYEEVLGKLKVIKHIHAHFSGIEYTDKGEKRHLITPQGDIENLLKAIIKAGPDITIINESPDPMGDSIRTKKALHKMI